MPHCRRAYHGFAYLWVLLLIAFMGVGFSLAAEVAATATQRDKEQDLLRIGHQFRAAIGSYYEGFGRSQPGAPPSVQAGGLHEYPGSLDDLLEDRRGPEMRRHLRRIFVDPTTGKPEWGLVLVGGRIVGIHSLSDREPIKRDNFDAEDAAFRDSEKYSEWIFTYPPELLLQTDGDTSLPPAPYPGNSSTLREVVK